MRKKLGKSILPLLLTGFLAMLLVGCSDSDGSESGGQPPVGSDPGSDGALSGQVVVSSGSASAASSGVQAASSESIRVNAYLEGSDEPLGSTTADSQGRFSILVGSEALAQINPVVPEGADGPRGGIVLVAQQQGSLRAAVSRSSDSWSDIRITPQTEAYAALLETTGRFSSDDLMAFPGSQGWINSSHDLSGVITQLESDMLSYFQTGTGRPNRATIIQDALNFTAPEFLASFTGGERELVQRTVVAGGTTALRSGVRQANSIDGTPIEALGEGNFRIGSGSEYSDTYLHLIVGQGDSEVHRIAPISLRPRQESQIARQQVTPQSGATLGNGTVSMRLHPFSLQEDTEITLTQVSTEGETIHGRPILRMEPSGLQFDRPVEVTISYQGVGVDDPDTVDWLYGSEEQGYQAADIVGVDRLAGNITLSVQHFSEILVKETPAERMYTDLANNYVVLASARDKRHGPTLDEPHIESHSSRVITNRLVEGVSTSNRGRNYLGTLGGSCPSCPRLAYGQCVPFAGSFLFPLLHGTSVGNQDARQFFEGEDSLATRNAYAHWGRMFNDEFNRERASDCQRWDYVVMRISQGTGHTAVYLDGNEDGFRVLESNWHVNNQTLANTGYVVSGAHIERYGIGAYSFDDYTYGGTSGARFMCISPERWEQNNAAANSWQSVNSDEKPWLYYLVSDQNNGKTELANNAGYEFDADLFPVAPLMVNHQTERSVIRDTRAARYAIYVSNTEASYTANWADDLRVAPVNPDNSFQFPTSGTDDGLTLLTRLQVPSHRFAASHPTRAGEVSMYAKSWLMLDSSLETRKLVSSENTKVLYSPIVIDDAYVSYSNNFKWDCSPGDSDPNCVRIGMHFTDASGDSVGSQLTYRERPAWVGGISWLESNSIYRDNLAVNGYFSTIGADMSATWNFAHAGRHHIYVNLPLGNIQDQLDAVYRLRIGAAEPVDLKICDQVAYGSSSSTGDFRWYRLVKATPNGHCPAQPSDEDTLFRLTGSDSLVLKNEQASPLQVDAIQLVTIAEANRDDVRTARISVSAELTSGFAEGLVVRYRLQSCDVTGCFTPISSGSVPMRQAGASIDMTSLLQGGYRLNLVAVYDAEDEQGGARAQSSGSQYLPETVYFTVDDDFSGNLPSVVLRRAGQRNVNIRVVDSVTGSFIPNAQVNVRYGAGRDDDTVAFSGQTNGSGIFAVESMPYGTYTASINAEGYARTLSRIDVGADTENQVTIIATQNVAADQARIVLSWGANPRDLDSHLLRFTGGSQDYHVFYSSPRAVDSTLDRDVTSGYGPETVTINPVSTNRTYRYVVHHFSGSSDIANSGAVVSLTYGNISRNFYPPNEQGRWWHVFDKVNGQIQPCQTNCMGSTLQEALSSGSAASQSWSRSYVPYLPTKH